MARELWFAAILGSVLPDVIRIAKGRHKGLPKWLASIGYWVALLALIALGILAVAITEEYIEPELTFLPALGIGYAAPDVIARIVSKSGTQGDITATTKPTFRDWWAL